MKRLRRIAILTLVLLAVPSVLAAASSGLSGTYTTTVNTAGALNGRYQITFSPGHFVLDAPYGIVGHGTDAISGRQITLHGPGKCASAGVYEFKTSGPWLSFRKIRDSCPRAKVLTAHALRRT